MRMFQRLRGLDAETGHCAEKRGQRIKDGGLGVACLGLICRSAIFDGTASLRLLRCAIRYPPSSILYSRFSIFFPGLLPQLPDQARQRLPFNELHDVIMHAALAADTEDWHDVGVVQVGGRL